MTSRYWWMAAVVAVAVLMFPGAVSANSNGHHSIHNGANQGNKPNDPPNSGNNEGSKDSQGKAPGHKKEPRGFGKQLKDVHHDSGNRNQPKGKAEKNHSNSEIRNDQAAEHASEQAKRHATEQSAVHKTAERSQTSKKKQNQGQGKTEHPEKAIHNHSLARVKDTVQDEKKSKKSAPPPEQGSAEDIVLSKDKMRINHQKASKKGHMPKQAESSKSPSQSGGSSSPADVPDPVAVVTLTAFSSGSGSHPHPQKSQDSYFSGVGYGITPEREHSNRFSVQLFVSRRAQYGNQWINAPPSPPPKNASLF
ncbi:MAG TPA: hypothetical protein VF199_02140 [Bacillales bacterium]